MSFWPASEVQCQHVDVEKTIERMLAVQAQMQVDAAASQAEIRASLAEVARRQADAEVRMDRAEARMDRMEASMAKFDKRLEVTRRLVQAGIKFVTKLAVEGAADRKRFEYKLNALITAQQRTEEQLKHFIASLHRARPDGHDRPSRRS